MFKGSFMKKVKPVLFLMLFLVSIILIPLTASAATSSVEIKLSSYGSPSWAKLYVNGRYKGRVSRGRSKTLSLTSGKRYTIRMYRKMTRAYYYKTKSFYLAANAPSKLITIRMRKRTIRTSKYRRLRIKLSRRSFVAWAKLYVNGRYRGRIYRRRYRTFRVKGGRRLSITAKRRYRGANYFAKRRVSVSSSRRTRYIFLNPRRQDGDDGE